MLSCSHQRDPRRLEPCAILLGLLLLSWTARWADATEPGNVEHGMRLYRYYCAPCHGTEGTEPVAMLPIWSSWDAPPEITRISGT